MGCNKLNLPTDTFTPDGMDPQNVPCQRVYTGEESTGIFQKCFPGCLYQSEILVKRNSFKMGFLTLVGWKEPQRPWSPGLRHRWLWIIHCEAPNNGNERQPAQVSRGGLTTPPCQRNGPFSPNSKAHVRKNPARASTLMYHEPSSSSSPQNLQPFTMVTLLDKGK